MSRATGRLRSAAALALVGLVATALPVAAAPTSSSPAALGSGDARVLLERAAAHVGQPHVGRVSVVTFTADGPRVADLEIRVGTVGQVELRRPTRWLVGAPGGSWVRTAAGAVPMAPAAAGPGLDVDAVLERWDATVGPPRGLDTGPATPVHLVRRSGTAVEEVVYVDEATGLAVRRETRAEDGRVLRVVAYTALDMVDLGGPGPVATDAAAGPVDPAAVQRLQDDGYDVPDALGAGFELMMVDHREGIATARYGDGLSVLSVYQQHGRLDPAAFDGAVVREIADRDVWTWPGTEPLRLAWTGGDRTWTVVSDAPVEVIEDALADLPGEHIGHDVPSRIVRGVQRVWRWARSVVDA